MKTVKVPLPEPRLAWLYEGLWGLLTHAFCVPRFAPVLPVMAEESIHSRKPSPNYLKYSKLQFYVLLIVIAIPSIGVSVGLAVSESSWLWLLVAAVVVLLIFIAVVGYLALHLRYDTMWYVFSDRSMRLRRGIWLIRESTITFENIQNVKVMQGPLQRLFGIADVVVETAGGGGSQTEGGGLSMHSGVMEGLENAAEIRDSIMRRVQTAQCSGLGDDDESENTSLRGWSSRHLALLAEIRDLANQAATMPAE